MSLIKLESISKNYGVGQNRVEALKKVSLDIYKGDMVAVLGTSGSGKSTLMNIIGCLDTPTNGKYYLDGRDVSRMTDYQLSIVRGRKVGFVFQSFNLIPSLSALENVELPLIYRGISRNRSRTLAKEALKKVGLENRIKHKPSELSGGQQQRVAIARAIASRPPVILADEPTGNLDSKSGREVMELLKNLNSIGHTVVIITHDIRLASEIPQKIVISDGKIIENIN